MIEGQCCLQMKVSTDVRKADSEGDTKAILINNFWHLSLSLSRYKSSLSVISLPACAISQGTYLNKNSHGQAKYS